MDLNILTTAEESLMKLLWQMETFYLKDIMEKHPEPKPHQNTVSTYLKILVEKNFLGTEKEGRIFKYSVKVPYPEYKTFLVKTLVEHHFDNSKPEFIKFLIDQKIVESSDLSDHFAIKTSIIPIVENSQTTEESNPLSDYIEELIHPKKEDKKGKDKDKKKDKKKKKK